MSQRQSELFVRPPAQRRKLAHVTDAGSPGRQHMAVFGCRCGWSSGWVVIGTITEAKRGIPCERCNQSTEET